MKIAIIAPCPPPYGGIIRVVENHLAQWTTDKIEAHFVPMYAPDAPKPPTGATFVDLTTSDNQGSFMQSLQHGAALAWHLPVTRPANAMRVFRYAAALENYVRKHKIDLIYAHELWPAGAIANVVAKKTGTTSVVVAYGESFGVEADHRRARRVNKWVAKQADFLLATSCHCLQSALNISGRPTDKTQVIYAGIDIDTFNPSVDGSSWRNRNGINFDAFVVSVLGLVLRRKLDIFVEALRLMNSDTKVVAVIGGEGQDQQHFQDITKGMENVELLFAGFIPEEELPEFYAASDVLVVSPRTELECMGQSMKEAMACSVATVGANIGGIPEAIDDGINGLLYEPDNPADLAQALNHLRTDPYLKQRLAAAGRITAEAKFGADVAAETVLNVFERAIVFSNN
jgi:glycosyltransferase involved in cell wall biosynthesis